jgi:hypothetical protein
MKPILKEVCWIAAAAGVTVLITVLLWGKLFLNHDLDIHFHDTYIVLDRWHILLPVFLFSCFLLYFIKEKRNSFKNSFQNWIFLVSGLLLLIFLSYFVSFFSKMSTNWTVYPPLSGLGNTNWFNTEVNHFVKPIVLGLFIVQFLVLLLLLYFLYGWGKNRR